ncbi:polysaccharide pyruvyl transferase family protein [Sanguibacter suaedae]|uniref:Polysaccharide pyruvyl transferase family protein n=1 Tax=Sanguibacter suaedae TaxID=2795737 RepID=A0A934MB17_9MICO|nr:polysaccharide pyruvyl transferase family protein [Sanguibacter suaedae]MBI9116200.1 polysaccharide pyruvyl transferase family protein [Sanguibacter suaedae]
MTTDRTDTVHTSSESDLKALILWSDNRAANLGLRVLAQGNAQLLRRSLGDRPVTVDFQDFGPGDSDVSFGTRSILKDLGRRHGPIKSKVRRYDVLVDTGAGDSFTDIYGLKRLLFIAYAHHVARRLRVPLVMAPQTFGPFDTRIGRALGRRSARQAVCAIARDDKSARYAEEQLGRAVDATTTDVVFLLPRESPGTGHDVVVNVSGLLWFASDHVDCEYYRQQVVTLVRGLLEAGREVTLLPHVVHSPSGNDDVDASRALVELLGADSGVRTVVPESLAEARQVLASAQVAVGARMHACLNALSQGVPAVPWAYSRKFAPLMARLGWSYLVDLRDGGDAAGQTLALILDPQASARMSEDVTQVGEAAERELEPAVTALARALSAGRTIPSAAGGARSA